MVITAIVGVLTARWCTADCLGTVSRREATQARHSFQVKPSSLQSSWVITYLATHHKQEAGQRKFIFTIGATQVCMEAWRMIHGIAVTRLWRLRHLSQGTCILPAGYYIGWPRKNATTLVVNFKDIVNKTNLFFILLGRKFIFQQNDTMTINFG